MWFLFCRRNFSIRSSLEKVVKFFIWTENAKRCLFWKGWMCKHQGQIRKLENERFAKLQVRKRQRERKSQIHFHLCEITSKLRVDSTCQKKGYSEVKDYIIATLAQVEIDRANNTVNNRRHYAFDWKNMTFLFGMQKGWNEINSNRGHKTCSEFGWNS